jgi:hypothetical protein
MVNALAQMSTLVSAIFKGGNKSPQYHYANNAVVTVEDEAADTIKISTTPFDPPLFTMITSPAFRSPVAVKK